MDQASSRYQGKPLLRLLECYVLWAIDELPGEYEALMGEMTPKLYAVYGLEGRWQDVLQQLMEMPPGMPALIQETWQKNQAIAVENGADLSPQLFAEMFVDANFASAED